MNKIVSAVAALFASAVLAPAAQAYDCSDPDDAAEVAACVRGAVKKVPGIPQVLPPVARPSVVIKPECDADDADDVKECLRGLKLPSAGRVIPQGTRPAAEIPVEKKLPAKVETAPPAPPPAPVAAPEKPAKVGGLEESGLCQKYFPNIGKLISVPCPANQLDAANDTRLCQKYFPNVGQMVTVPCSE
jgi:hypothetical protein